MPLAVESSGAIVETSVVITLAAAARPICSAQYPKRMSSFFISPLSISVPTFQ